jgi:uncharacterized membrane protein YkgB
MKKIQLTLANWEELLIRKFIGNSMFLLRVSIGIVYVLFGTLKFFPNFSPAEELAGQTISLITFDLISGQLAMILLGSLEVIIGLGLLVSFKLRWILLVGIWHMLCTFLPLVILPEFAFTEAPISLSLVGQYILKNIILISVMLVVYCDLRMKSKASFSRVIESSPGENHNQMKIAG